MFAQPLVRQGEARRVDRVLAAAQHPEDRRKIDGFVPSAGFEPAAYCSGGSRSIP